MSRLKRLVDELKRRRVFRVAVVYAAVAFVVWQVAEIAIPGLRLPDLVLTAVIVLTILGFPIALVLAWAYDITPAGVVHTEREAESAGTEGPAPSSEVPAKTSIVVLPFDNLSPDPGDAYFSDGLTEEIITDLSYVRSLRVISRSSAMALKGTQKDVRTIGNELDVQYVLEGSVRKAGDDLRITAQLIDATTDEHLWAERYSGTLEDVFDIQERVSHSIVDALKLQLRPEEERRLVARPIEDPKAYECYLRARSDTYRFTEDGLERALQELWNALEILGDNVLIQAGLGHVYFQYVNAGVSDDEVYLQKAEECARKIFEMEPDSHHGHLLTANVHYKRGDIQQAVRSAKRAVALEPNDPDSFSLVMLVLWYGDAGRPSAALPLVEKLQAIDPLNPYTHWAAGWPHVVQGEFELALGPHRRMHTMAPDNPILRVFYGQTLAFSGRLDEACSVLDPLASETPQTMFELVASLFKAALRGEKAKALDSLTEELEARVLRDEICSWWMAECCALLDERQRALDWLEHVALSRGFINYPFLSEIDPFLESVRGEKRFEQLMERVRYEWEHFEA